MARSHPITRFTYGWQGLVYHWICLPIGVPSLLQHFGVQCHQVSVQLHRTTAYHPQANGLVERFHRTMKAPLMARLAGHNWFDELPWIIARYSLPKEDLKASSAEFVCGEPLTVPGSFIAQHTAPWTPSFSFASPHCITRL